LTLRNKLENPLQPELNRLHVSPHVEETSTRRSPFPEQQGDSNSIHHRRATRFHWPVQLSYRISILPRVELRVRYEQTNIRRIIRSQEQSGTSDFLCDTKPVLANSASSSAFWFFRNDRESWTRELTFSEGSIDRLYL